MRTDKNNYIFVFVFILLVSGCASFGAVTKMCERSTISRNDEFHVSNPTEQDVSVSGMTKKRAKLILNLFRSHIAKEAVLVYNDIALENIIVYRIFTLPGGEIIIGFISGGAYYSVEFDWKNLHTSNLRLNILD